MEYLTQDSTKREIPDIIRCITHQARLRFFSLVFLLSFFVFFLVFFRFFVFLVLFCSFFVFFLASFFRHFSVCQNSVTHDREIFGLRNSYACTGMQKKSKVFSKKHSEATILHYAQLFEEQRIWGGV